LKRIKYRFIVFQRRFDLLHIEIVRAVRVLTQQLATSVAEKFMESDLNLKSRYAVLVQQLLILGRQEWNNWVLVRRWDDIAQRNVLETFVLTDLIICAEAFRL
jgi:hypothetical protein